MGCYVMIPAYSGSSLVFRGAERSPGIGFGGRRVGPMWAVYCADNRVCKCAPRRGERRISRDHEMMVRRNMRRFSALPSSFVRPVTSHGQEFSESNLVFGRCQSNAIESVNAITHGVHERP
jgi:hypothetical protein